MKQKESQLCRLCLRTISNEHFEDTGKITMEILRMLQLKLNFHIDEEYIVCSSCMGSIEECLDFKLTYMNTEDYIVSMYNFETMPRLDLKEVYIHKNKHIKTAEIAKDLEICRLCMKLNKRSSCKPLIEIEEDLLRKCIPELNFNLTKEPVICESCMNFLKLNFQFLQTCMDTEEKIIKYYTFEATGGKGQINLNEIVKFTKNISEYERRITQVNVDFDGLRCGSKENNVIETGIVVENENVEFDRENVENDIETEVEENIKIEINADSLKLHNGELETIYEQNIDLEVLCCENKENNVIETFTIVEEENVVFDRENIEKDVEENTMKPGKNGDYLKLQNKKLEMIWEQSGLQTKQSDFESSRDAPTSSQLIMKNTNICNPNDDMDTHQELLENMDEIKYAYIYRNSPEATLYNCGQCSYKTKHKHCLKTHMLIHRDFSEVPVYKCESCSYVAKDKRSFDIHTQNHRDISEAALYNCVHCSFKTRYKNSLRSHNMLTHREVSKATLHGCNECSFKTKRKRYLKTHMLVHRDFSEVPLYNCESCSFISKRKASLKAHMLIHQDSSEAKVYTCKSCSYATKHKAHLKRHMVTHESSEMLIHMNL